MSKKVKISIFAIFNNTFVFASYWFYITIFATKKAKIAKDIFNKKALIADISVTYILITTFLILHFLQAKK